MDKVKIIYSVTCLCFISYLNTYITCSPYLSTTIQSRNDDIIRLWQPKPKKEKNISSNFPKALLRQRRYSTRFSKIEKLLEKDKTNGTESFDNGNDNEYLSPYTIKLQLTNLAKKIQNASVTVETIGRTAEYNDIVLLKITEENKKIKYDSYRRTGDNKYDDDIDEKKIIFIVHGLSVMGVKQLECLYDEEYFLPLVSYYTDHLDYFDIYLIPMANPDGFAMNKVVKAWNKNAALQGDCPGVALDRNFDVAWSNNRSINSCNQEYPGPVPFSEAETKAIRDIFHKYSHKIVAYFNVHAGSYYPFTFKGDAVLYPKGYMDSGSDDDKYTDLRGEIEEAIRNATFRVLSVTVDTLYNWYGRVTGTSVDYASTVYGIPFALELVMQLYEDKHDDEWSEYYSWRALNEVWGRVIDVIFEYIWKTLQENEVG